MLFNGNICNMKCYSSNVNSCIWTQFLLVWAAAVTTSLRFHCAQETDTKIDFMQITYQVVSVDKDSLDGCGCWSKTETDLIIHVLLLTHCCPALTNITWGLCWCRPIPKNAWESQFELIWFKRPLQSTTRINPCLRCWPMQSWSYS